jgi:hypothetical protein
MEEIIRSMAKFIILTGIMLILVGALFFLASSFQVFDFKLKKLPGDILIKKDNFTFFFPITTSIILSAILTLILNIIGKIIRH